MTDSQQPGDRERQVRRTTSARRVVVATGAVGALGAAVAIGVGTQTGGTNAGEQDDQANLAQQGTTTATSRARDDEGEGGDDGVTRQRQQPRQSAPQNQLAAPGGAGPAHAGSGGS